MFSIAIDGPAGAGKSTLAKRISKRLNIVYIDTGAMYRAVGYNAVSLNVDCRDWNAVSKTLSDIKIDIEYSLGAQEIFVNDENVTGKIRTPEISLAASLVAVIPEVRIKLVEMQREIAKNHDVVMDGRDIGTYVLPDADYKFFVTASVEERAHRRWLELKALGETKPIDEVERDIRFRDANDSGREFAPLYQADDAVLIDTTKLSIEQAVDTILKIVKKQEKQGEPT